MKTEVVRSLRAGATRWARLVLFDHNLSNTLMLLAASAATLRIIIELRKAAGDVSWNV